MKVRLLPYTIYGNDRDIRISIQVMKIDPVQRNDQENNESSHRRASADPQRPTRRSPITVVRARIPPRASILSLGSKAAQHWTLTQRPSHGNPIP